MERGHLFAARRGGRFRWSRSSFGSPHRGRADGRRQGEAGEGGLVSIHLVTRTRRRFRCRRGRRDPSRVSARALRCTPVRLPFVGIWGTAPGVPPGWLGGAILYSLNPVARRVEGRSIYPGSLLRQFGDDGSLSSIRRSFARSPRRSRPRAETASATTGDVWSRSNALNNQPSHTWMMAAGRVKSV